MTFLAPQWLALAVLVGALAVAYVVLQQRRRHYAVRFTNVDLLASVAPHRPGWRRHVPAGVMALALLGLVVGLARPARETRVPKDAAMVMLVIDTSASMDATDVEPSRLRAAVDAAGAFVADLPESVEIGLVSFDRSPRLLATPTADHAAVADRVRALTTGPGTAAGEAVYVALDAIATAQEALGAPPPTDPERPVAAIVLLSDGVTTVGRPVELAAEEASRQRVPITTIAFGTDEGTVEVQGQVIRVPADRPAMSAVADSTGGSFFEAASGEQLRSVYDDIGGRVGYTTEQREVGMAFVGASLALLVIAMAAALLWTSRVL